jgi:hypothetical protein
MNVRAALLLLVPLTLSAASAQTVKFDLRAGGKSIGKDEFTIAKTKQGYKLASRFNYALGVKDGQFSNEYRADDNYTLIDCGMINTGNTVHYGFSPNKARTELTINTAQGGSQSNDFTPIKPDFLLLTDFDPAAAQLILLHAVTHPTPDNKYNVLVPQLGGSGGGGGRGRGAAPPDAAEPKGDDLPPGNNSYDALWAKGRDLTGTLDEKPVTVHTYQLAFGTFRWIFFADDANNLMQLNVTRLHSSYIREGFKLDPIKAPDAK